MYEIFTSIVETVKQSGAIPGQYGRIIFKCRSIAEAQLAFGGLTQAKQGTILIAAFPPSQDFEIGWDYYEQLQDHDYTPRHPGLPAGDPLVLYVKYEAGQITPVVPPITSSPEKLFLSIVETVKQSGAIPGQYGRIIFKCRSIAEAQLAFGGLTQAKQGTILIAAFPPSQDFEIGWDYYEQLQDHDYTPRHPGLPAGNPLVLDVKYEAGQITSTQSVQAGGAALAAPNVANAGGYE